MACAVACNILSLGDGKMRLYGLQTWQKRGSQIYSCATSLAPSSARDLLHASVLMASASDEETYQSDHLPYFVTRLGRGRRTQACSALTSQIAAPKKHTQALSARGIRTRTGRSKLRQQYRLEKALPSSSHLKYSDTQREIQSRGQVRKVGI